MGYNGAPRVTEKQDLAVPMAIAVHAGGTGVGDPDKQTTSKLEQ
jgi:hypothetical protein